MGKKRSFCVALAIGALFLSAPSFSENAGIVITDIKTAEGISEKFEPVKPSKNFRKGSTKVFCWFSWRDNDLKLPVTAKWTYVTDDIHILDYNVPIARTNGSGGTSFSMPAGKELPSGEYRVDLMADQKILKSASFTVSDK